MPVNSVENRLLLYAVDGENYSPIALSLYDISIDNVVETDDSQSIKHLKYLQNSVSMTITLPHKKCPVRNSRSGLCPKELTEILQNGSAGSLKALKENIAIGGYISTDYFRQRRRAWSTFYSIPYFQSTSKETNKS